MPCGNRCYGGKIEKGKKWWACPFVNKQDPMGLSWDRILWGFPGTDMSPIFSALAPL